MLTESLAEIAIGITVEAGLLALVGGVIYRFFAGRFLVPKREVILPHQVGVLQYRGEYVRVLPAGFCWVRPGRKLMLVDVRPRRMQVEGIEVFSRERAVLRVSVSGEYKIAQPEVFLGANGNAGDAAHFELRRIMNVEARELPLEVLLDSPTLLTDRVRSKLSAAIRSLGLVLDELQVWRSTSPVAVRPYRWQA